MTPLNTVIVTPQIPIAYQNGGIGTFVRHFQDLLLTTGDNRITIILTEPPQRPDPDWIPLYQENGIDVTCVQRKPLDLPPGYFRSIKISELVASSIPEDAEIVYFADWRANGLHTVRRRRFKSARQPIVVTVLHGNTEWNRHGSGMHLTSYEEVAEEFFERYVVENSDFVASPSKHLVQWCEKNEWRLPSHDRTAVLRYPFFPRDQSPNLFPACAQRFQRIVFFGRLETRKGFQLFVEALLSLKNKPCLSGLVEVVFLGSEGEYKQMTPEQGASRIETELNIKVNLLEDLDSEDANDYLKSNTRDTLVVLPSVLDNFPYTVIEASMIPSLNMVCSKAGGISEILGSASAEQLFEPTVAGASQTIELWLEHGPKTPRLLFTYDWQSANQKWLAFHAEIAEYARRALSVQPNPSLISPRNESTERVDVCIPYFNAGPYLPELLLSLSQQTVDNFNVYVVNDGSTDTLSQLTFERLAAKYKSRGWVFVATPNRGPCEARNYAASLGDADYICFVDADNLVAPNMVNCFLESITTSGDDCLTSYLYGFQGDGSPYLTPRGSANPILTSPPFVYLPIGNCPEAGILNNPFGDVSMIVCREVFDRLGGFPTDYEPTAGNEDYEFLTKLSLQGYKLDVVPEFLFYYRQRSGSRTKTMDFYLSEMRVLRNYEDELKKLGLRRLVSIVTGLKHRCYLNYAQVRRRHRRWSCGGSGSRVNSVT